jgi:hypothetical protein
MTWLVTLLERLMARRATRWTPSLGSAGGYVPTLTVLPSGALQRRKSGEVDR